MKVKICGICRAPDAQAADELGADYIGVILAPGRKRSQNAKKAAEIYGAVKSAERVGVFVDPTFDEVSAALRTLRLDVVQLHGNETPELAHRISASVRVWKAIAVKSPSEFMDAIAAFADVDAVVLDHGAGGSGEAFDWTEAASLRANFPPQLGIVVAGGLTASNVGAAIQTLQPAVVDVSSGVETSLCVKSYELMREFITNAKESNG